MEKMISNGTVQDEQVPYIKRNIDQYLTQFLVREMYADLRVLIGRKLVTAQRFDKALASMPASKAFSYIVRERALPDALVLLHKQSTATLTALIEADDFDTFKWFVDHGFVKARDLDAVLDATITFERTSYRPMLLALREDAAPSERGKMRL